MSDFISLNTVKELLSHLGELQESRRSEMQRLSDEFGDISRLIKYYIEPNCQHHNPADWDETHHFASSIQMPVFSFLNRFLKEELPESDGRHQLFILSDAGMGKTSLLIMLNLMHLNRFWPTKLKCELFRLQGETVEKINKLEGNANTILLLDALDEDASSFGRVEDRLLELLVATKKFRKVIISCRTQFFPKGGKDPFDMVGRIRIGSYVCPTIFLSLFDDNQVESYLKKRFPRNKEKIRSSKNILDKTASLKFRPLLLSYIEDILDSRIPINEWSEYSIYLALVEAWLLREERKLLEMERPISTKHLWEATIQLAIEMNKKGQRFLPLNDIEKFLSTLPGMEIITSIDIGGRSLLVIIQTPLAN